MLHYDYRERDLVRAVYTNPALRIGQPSLVVPAARLRHNSFKDQQPREYVPCIVTDIAGA